MKWKWLIPIALASLLQSCIVSQKISNGKVLKTSNQKLYKDLTKSKTYELEGVENNYTFPTKVSEVRFEDKNMKAIIYPSDKEGVLVIVSKEASPNEGIYYYGSAESIKNDGKTWKKEDYGMKYLNIKYRSGRFSYQAISVPMKIRTQKIFETATPGVMDTTNYSISTGFNAGFSFGYKVSRVNHFYTLKSKDKVEQMKRAFSWTPSAFIGLTPVSLTSTNSPGLAEDRTVVGFTYGFGAVVGYDRFNIGLFMGFDVPFGTDGDAWVYKNVPWYGLVVALDFIK